MKKTEKQEKKKTSEKPILKDDRGKVRSGMIVSVHEKIIDTTAKGERRERIQIFKGMVLARKHGREPGATITVRKQSGDFGVEKIFPIYSPIIERVVIEKIFKTRRSKLYFLRGSKKRLRELK
jgi:large subunit ribosomal protein L19